MRHSVSAAVLGGLAMVLFAACESTARRNGMLAVGGDRGRGASLISDYGCGSCHTVPGVPGAHGLVGPSLAGVQTRVCIAGSLANDPATLSIGLKIPILSTRKL